MLHILWMILKFILIVLGILLGVLVLALLLLLFCPVQYEAEGAGDLKEWKKAQAGVRVSWLFRGIMVKVSLNDGKVVQSIRIFGIPLDKLLKKKGSASKTAASSGPKQTKEKEKPPAALPQKPSVQKTPDSHIPEKEASLEDLQKIAKEEKEREISIPKKTPEEPREGFPKEPPKESPKEPPKAPQKEASQSEAEAQKHSEQEYSENPKEKEIPKEKEPGIFSRIRNKVSAFLEKLRKIPETVRNFISKLRGIYDKIDYWKQFLTHPRVREAFSYAWQCIKVLLKHMFPTMIRGHVTFGSEDPSITGAVLAALGITMSFHKNCIEAHPVFEGTNLLYGDVKLQGRVYGFMIVKTALQIYFNKNIKYVINRWKHKEESL